MKVLSTLLAILAVSLCTAGAQDAGFLVKGQVVRVMPLGDSITLGKNGGVGGYRKILYEWLKGNGYPITYVGKQNIPGNPRYPATCSDGSIPWHEGYGSFRTDQTLNGGTAEHQTAPPLATTLANYNPDVVLLMIGTNDLLQKWRLDGLETRLGAIVDAIYAYNPKAIVLVAGIAPLGGWTHAEQEKRAVAYNAAIQDIVAARKAQGRRIGFVDVHAALSAKGGPGLAKGALGPDMVHPSNLGYALMAQAWYKALTGQDAPAIADTNNPLQLPPPLPLPSPGAPPVTAAKSPAVQ